MDFHIDTSPNGASWISVASLTIFGIQLAIFVGPFNQGRQFRVELYIDTYDRERNKYVFDTLFQHREEIEEQVKEKLQRECIDQKPASRVAWYYHKKISIESSDADLAELRTWSASAMVRFYQAIANKADAALNSIS